MWADKSGNGRDVMQSNNTYKPATGIAAQNGLNTISFDPSSQTQWLTDGVASRWVELSDGTPYIIAAVAKSNSSSTSMLMGSIEGNSGDIGFWMYQQGSNQMWHLVMTGSGYGLAVNNKVTGGTSTSPVIHTLLADPANATASLRSSLYANAGSAAQNNTSTDAPTISDPVQSLIIGASNQFGDATYVTLGWDGWIGEIVIITGADATEDNRVILRDYLNTKWAIF
jgi:hypothetical protein